MLTIAIGVAFGIALAPLAIQIVRITPRLVWTLLTHPMFYVVLGVLFLALMDALGY